MTERITIDPSGEEAALLLSLLYDEEKRARASQVIAIERENGPRFRSLDAKVKTIAGLRERIDAARR